MAEKKPSSKIDKSILIVDGIASEQHLLEAIVYGENRESALKKAEKIIECLIDEHEGHYGFIEQLSKVIKNNPIGPLTLFAVLMKHTEIEASYRAKVSASIWHSDNPKQNEKNSYFNVGKNGKKIQPATVVKLPLLEIC